MKGLGEMLGEFLNHTAEIRIADFIRGPRHVATKETTFSEIYWEKSLKKNEDVDFLVSAINIA